MDETRRRRKTGVNPSLGFWLEIIGAPILIAFYAEAYSSKDYAVGVFLEIEILTVCLALYFELFNLEEPVVGLWIESSWTGEGIPVGFYVETLLQPPPVWLPPLFIHSLDDLRGIFPKSEDLAFGGYMEGYQNLAAGFDQSSRGVFYADALIHSEY